MYPWAHAWRPFDRAPLQSSMSILLPSHFTYAFLVRDSSKIAPRHIYSATRDPLPSIVIENVANDSLEPIMDKELRCR